MKRKGLPKWQLVNMLGGKGLAIASPGLRGQHNEFVMLSTTFGGLTERVHLQGFRSIWGRRLHSRYLAYLNRRGLLTASKDSIDIP